MNRNRRFLALSLITAAAIQACAGSSQKDSSLLQNGFPSSASIDGLPWLDEAATTDPNHLTLAVKYVTYLNPNGTPVAPAHQVKAAIQEANKLYSVCNMHFRVEEYLPAVVETLGLPFSPSMMGDLDPIRNHFDSEQHLLVVATGAWNHSGGLGANGANAWTMLPGQTPSGAILESKVSVNGDLIGHELGHYLSLNHVQDTANMMNPVIYSSSTTITQNQCQTMRETAVTTRSAALRTI